MRRKGRPVHDAEVPHSVNGLRAYVDAKFQTIEAAAREAKQAADRAIERSDEVNKTYATKDAHSALETKFDALMKIHGELLSKNDYETRHIVLEEKIAKLQETPWGTIASLGMVLLVMIGGFWGLAYGPIQSRFEQLEKRDLAAAEALTLVRSHVRETERLLSANVATATKMGEDHQRQIERIIAEMRLFATKDEINNYRRYIEDHNALQDRRLDERMPKEEFNQWEKERGRLIDSINARIDRLFSVIDTLNARLFERTQAK